MTSCKINNV